ncbi:OmpA family protein [Sphingomonas sp.]|uniref:OmpA family protein n=1 Tax=Sphingomonas sp. TaxID=28214 RepID=UPI0031E0F0BF
MTVRSGRSMGMVAVAGFASLLAGCGDAGGNSVARAAGTNGATIEMAIPDPAPSASATPHAAATDGLSGLNAPNPGPTVATIGFPQGGAVLDTQARAALDRLAADPAAGKGRIILRGHSDSDGDDEANRIMSRKRAEAVRDYLVRKGLTAARIGVIALGETRPVAPNAKPDGSDDAAGRARNRRVEIELAAADR